jgi:hypothetical protein
MCSIILRLTEVGVEVAGNRDEMQDRPWEPPAEYWPGIIGGRDVLAGGTWLAVNRAGVMATLLNRAGTLGPAAGKNSRGELPLQALQAATAAEAAALLAGRDAAVYRPFNLVLADATAIFFLRGLGEGVIEARKLAPGTHMVSSGEPDDLTLPRLARHLPRFAAAPFADWGTLLADTSGTRAEQINIRAAENSGFGTICATLLRLTPGHTPEQQFAAGPPDVAPFRPLPSVVLPGI